MSRATLYTEEMANRICDSLLDGQSLVKICEPEGMPHRATVMRWMQEDDAFATKCARAREMQADLMDDKILDVADASTPETAASDRVKISAYQWRASKLQPKKYGDKLSQDLTLGVTDSLAAVLADVATNGRKVTDKA